MNEFFGYKCGSPSPLILISGKLDMIYNNFQSFLLLHEFGILVVFCEDKDKYKYDYLCKNNNIYFINSVDKLKNLLCRQIYLMGKNTQINKKVLVIVDNIEADMYIQNKSSQEFKDLIHNHKAYFITCVVISDHVKNFQRDITINCNKTFEKKLLSYNKKIEKDKFMSKSNTVNTINTSIQSIHDIINAYDNPFICIVNNNTDSICQILKNLLFECEKSNKIDDCIIYSESHKCISNLKVLTELNYLIQHKYNDNLIKELLETSLMYIKKAQYYAPVIVFEGKLDNLMKYTGFFELMYNSKQYKITIIIITDPDSLPQELMHNIDITVIPFNNNVNIQKKIHEKFKQIYPIFKSFQHDLLKCSANTDILCINNRSMEEKNKKYFMEIKNNTPSKYLLPHKLDIHIRHINEIFNILNIKYPSIQIIGHENIKITKNVLHELESRGSLTNCAIYSSYDKSKWDEYDKDSKYYIVTPLNSVDLTNTLSQLCSNAINNSHEKQVVVFDNDDILNNEQYFIIFSNFVMNSRHYNIIPIFITDKVNLNFSTRCKFDVNMICFNSDKKAQQVLYDQFGQIFPTFDSFCSYFHTYTQNEKVCMIVNRLSKNFNDNFYSIMVDNDKFRAYDKKYKINHITKSILSLTKKDLDDTIYQQNILDKLMINLSLTI